MNVRPSEIGSRLTLKDGTSVCRMSTVSVCETASIESASKVSIGTAESIAERGLPRRPVTMTSSISSSAPCACATVAYHGIAMARADTGNKNLLSFRIWVLPHFQEWCLKILRPLLRTSNKSGANVQLNHCGD